MSEFSFGNGGAYSGLIISAIGIILLLAAIFNADWVFGDTRSFNIAKVQGWVNFFGRNTTRFFVGILSIVVVAFGLFWFWYKFTQ